MCVCVVRGFHISLMAYSSVTRDKIAVHCSHTLTQTRTHTHAYTHSAWARRSHLVKWQLIGTSRSHHYNHRNRNHRRHHYCRVDYDGVVFSKQM